MTLTIPELEEIVNAYVHSTNEESRQEVSKILDQWISSNESNETALEIIQGKSKSLILMKYAVFVILYHINKQSYTFPKEYYTYIFNICFDQIKKSELPPNDPLVRNLITLCAYSTYYSSDQSLFNNFQKFSPNILIYYLDDILNKDMYQTMMFYENTEPLFTNYDIFLETLPKADVCAQTFVLMKTLLSKIEISYFNRYLPLFQSGVTNGQCISSILTFFEALIGYEPSNLEEEDISFIKDFITILVSNVENFEDTYASFIWNIIICEMGNDFFCSEYVGNDFTSNIFALFQKSLKYFIENDIDEFYFLFGSYAECINYIPCEYESVNANFIEGMTAPNIEEFYQFVIAIVDIDLMFCNDSISDMLMMITESHSPQEVEKDLRLISDDDDDDDDDDKIVTSNELSQFNENDEEEEIDFFMKVINNFFMRNSGNISQGFIYVFSYAPIEIIHLYSSNIAEEIISSQEPPPTTVYFVTRCCQFLGDWIEKLIQICLQCFDYIKPRDIGCALLEFARKYSDKFVDKINDYLPVIFEVIKANDAQTSLPYFKTLFSIFPKIKDEGKDTQELFSVTGAQFLNQINDIASSLDAFRVDIFFLQDIAKEINSENSEIMKSFLYSLFNQIIENFGPLMTSQDLVIQENIAIFISEVLHNGWVEDREKILEWANAAILECPNDKHFDVFAELADLLPSKEFNEFLSKTDELDDELIRAEILFFIKVFKKNIKLIMDIPIDLILFFLTKSDFHKYTFKLIRKIVICQEMIFSEEDIKKILDSLLHCFFETCGGDDIPNCLRLIRTISIKYLSLDSMLKEILQIIGDYNESDVVYFCDLFKQDSDIQKEYLSEPCGAIIRIYRKNHQID